MTKAPLTSQYQYLYIFTSVYIYEWQFLSFPLCVSIVAVFRCTVLVAVGLTGRHKQDAGTQQDGVLAAIGAAHPHAETPQQQEGGAEDGEEAQCAHHTCSDTHTHID